MEGSYFLPKSAVQSVLDWKCLLFLYLEENQLRTVNNFQRARKKRIKLRMDWVLEVVVKHSGWVSKEN